MQRFRVSRLSLGKQDKYFTIVDTTRRNYIIAQTIVREIPSESERLDEDEKNMRKMCDALNAAPSRCDEHKRALVCPNCEARRRGKKGALAVNKKYDKATRTEWARKGGRPVTRSDAQESSLNVANE